ncbi:hypothetical protein C482_20086 [Natrialba chahannaoensis JCM 10990]|uniref:DUF2178 domain-containing protein n=1 Tax=Natrialba chahannaoensis JCM 10990 TaxID=1227492 RepID=M0A2N3_9EURY|nr:hypothetical protein [Natrialba chahannaoensis]ELY93010.1 hypothetical protein C482_20086 [Natrialba chahannaoensis JCM 10990]
MSDTRQSTNTVLGIGKRTYERAVWGLVGIGCLGLLAGILLEEQLIGTATYLVTVWAAMIVAVVVPYVSDTKLADERDERLHNRASGMTIGIAAMVGIGIVPALYVLGAGNYMTISARIWGGIYLFSGLGLLYVACYMIVSRHS